MKTFLLLLLVSTCGVPQLVAAETVLSAVSENDTYGSGKDQNYTNGARFSAFLTEADVPDFALRLADLVPWRDLSYNTNNPRKGVMYSLGHNLYTPEDTSRQVPDPQDRPYAALLYGSIGFASVAKDLSVVDETELMLGWLGPGAMGREIQQLVHEAVDAQKPRGWAHQLKDEPIVNLFWQRRWPRWRSMVLGPLRLSAAPHVGGAFGNAYIHANGGATLTLEPKDSPLQDHPLRVRPSTPGTGYFDASRNRLSWQLFAGVDGRLVGRNIFLDGNTFQESPHVNKNLLAGDAQAGAALTYKNIRLAYTLVYRTKEFVGQDDANVFGALSLSVAY